VKRVISGGIRKEREGGLGVISVSKEVRERIKEGARRKGLSVVDYMEYLVEFEELGRIDEVIDNLKRVERGGFSLKQLVHLSVLYTVMKRLAREYDL
jgi:cobalamin biosynthesis protein CobT